MTPSSLKIKGHEDLYKFLVEKKVSFVDTKHLRNNSSTIIAILPKNGTPEFYAELILELNYAKPDEVGYLEEEDETILWVML